MRSIRIEYIRSDDSRLNPDQHDGDKIPLFSIWETNWIGDTRSSLGAGRNRPIQDGFVGLLQGDLERGYMAQKAIQKYPEI